MVIEKLMKLRIGQALVRLDQSREGMCMDLGGQLCLEDRQGHQKQRKREERGDEMREKGASPPPSERRREVLQRLCHADLYSSSGMTTTQFILQAIK